MIYGGVSQNPQVKFLRSGTDVVIATPGRLLDLMNQGHVRLQDLSWLVLDEADRMSIEEQYCAPCILCGSENDQCDLAVTK